MKVAFSLINKHTGYIEDIQIFVMNMIFISSSEVKKIYISEIYIFTSRDEIRVISMTNS